MTLIHSTTTTTVTTTVETQLHVISEDDFVTLLSAFRATPLPPAAETRVIEQVRSEVVDALHERALQALEDGMDPDQWVAELSPLVEERFANGVVAAVLP